MPNIKHNSCQNTLIEQPVICIIECLDNQEPTEL